MTECRCAALREPQSGQFVRLAECNWCYAKRMFREATLHGPVSERMRRDLRNLAGLPKEILPTRL